MTAVFMKPYGGTGLTLGELDALPKRDRHAILAATIVTLREQKQVLADQLLEAEGLLRGEMLNEQATIADAGEWTVKLTTRTKWEYDLEVLTELQAFVTPEQYDEAVREVREVKVNKTKLNMLAKRGGQIAAIISRACVEAPAGFVLDIKR